MTIPTYTHLIRIERDPLISSDPDDDVDPTDTRPPPSTSPPTVIAEHVRAVIGRPTGSSTYDGGQRMEVSPELWCDPIDGLQRLDIAVDETSGDRWKIEWFRHTIPLGNLSRLAHTHAGLVAVSGEVSPTADRRTV